MAIKYDIHYSDQVVKKDIPKLAESIKHIVKKTIENKLIIDPVAFGKPLQFSLKGYRRLRVGDYRVVYKIILPNSVNIVAIKHRKEVYK